jgi:hypothetical protein
MIEPPTRSSRFAAMATCHEHLQVTIIRKLSVICQFRLPTVCSVNLQSSANILFEPAVAHGNRLNGLEREIFGSLRLVRTQRHSDTHPHDHP